MTLSKLKPLSRLLSRRSLAVSAAVRQDTNPWFSTPLLKVSPAAESLYHITVPVLDSPELAASYTKAGQYIQLRLRDRRTKPAFFAIASPPKAAVSEGVFEFLVKSIAGTTSEHLCKSREGDVVELSPVLGNGFDVGRLLPAEESQTILIFATGSGISAIRSLIESDFHADKRSDIRLYYGVRNLNRMAYQERFKEWQSYGIDIVPALSQPDDRWTGHRGYVQAAFSRDKRLLNPNSTAAVLCGHKQMAEEITSILVSDGVGRDKILKNI